MMVISKLHISIDPYFLRNKTSKVHNYDFEYFFREDLGQRTRNVPGITQYH